MFAVGNNLNRAHNYFQDFWKNFSILIKAQQLQLNRKTEINQKKREREATWALPVLAQPTRAATVSHLAPEGRQRDAGRVVAACEATSCFRRF